MSSDCYAILGVTPAAEDVVIGAAYRALMRHYHPDTNADPEAQERAREITAAYAILRDPAKRAEYDARLAEGVETWPAEELPQPTPPMRAAGIAAALLAIVLTTAVWLAPRDQPARQSAPAAAPQSATAAKHEPTKPIVQLEPEKERLASLAADIAPAEPPPPVVESVAEDPPPPVIDAPPSIPAKTPKLANAEARKLPKLASVAAPPKHELVKATPSPAPKQTERVATLDRMSSSFFSQSMTHATDAKKELLVAARDRSESKRKACHSDSCVADAFVRQIRETSAIMEGRTASPK